MTNSPTFTGRFTCSCDVCKDIAHYKSIKDSHNIDIVHRYMEEIYERLIEVEFDLDYYKALVRGTYPNADEVIAKVRRKRNGYA